MIMKDIVLLEIKYYIIKHRKILIKYINIFIFKI